MGFFRYLILLFCLCTITLTQAQRYEVDCLVSSEIKAVATDKPTEFDGSRTVLYLCNGTLVNVVGRKVAGTDGQEASHLKQAGDTLDVRQIKAVVEYDGKHYLAEARWLKFFFGKQALANSPMRTSKNGRCVTASRKMCQFCIKETGLLNQRRRSRDACCAIGCHSTVSRVNIRRDRSRGQILHCLIQR